MRTVPARVRRHVGSRTKGLYRYYVCSTRYGYWTQHCPGERLRVSGAAERTRLVAEPPPRSVSEKARPFRRADRISELYGTQDACFR